MKLLEIKPCRLGSRIRDIGAESYNKAHLLVNKNKLANNNFTVVHVLKLYSSVDILYENKVSFSSTQKRDKKDKIFQ